MKSTPQPKQKLPKITLIPDDKSLDFLKGKELFPEKNARAKEKLKNIQLPPRTISSKNRENQ